MIKKLFYRYFPPSRHPEQKRDYTNKAIKKVFKINGVQYYEFKNNMDMPWQRYLQLQQFIDEANTRISNKELIDYLNIFNEAANTGIYTTVAIINEDIQRRINMILNIDIMYSMFACVFFNLEDGEDLTEFDYDFNEEKIKLFKQQNVGDFFLQEPIRRFFPQLDLSRQNLKTLLKMSQVEEKRLSKLKETVKSKQQNNA